jgi:phosphoenolpyruvate synthase/pyruvate phosphate dikinase
MDKNQLNKIIKSLPVDFLQHCVRDISFLSCSIFGEVHAQTIKKVFGSPFSSTLWINQGQQYIFYRRQKEYDDFSRKIAEKCLKNSSYADRIADKLVNLTDKLTAFVVKNKSLEDLAKYQIIFFNLYKEFFAYHQAVYWGGDYLSQQKVDSKISKIINVLNRAYKYNELAIPKLEKYFKKLKISNCLYNDISNSKKTQFGLLFWRTKRFVLSQSEGDKLEAAMIKNVERFGNVKKIKGIGVRSGLVRGRVKVILELNRLSQIKKGDILVTTMTRPQFNNFIKKASVIVTDEGGVLCHAAILAREFKIPCVVGTKVATKILKDGDLVEVDADKGVVKKM